MYPHEMMQMALIGLVVDLRVSPFEEDALGRFPIDRLHPCYMASCNVLIKLMRETAERERAFALSLLVAWHHCRHDERSHRGGGENHGHEKNEAEDDNEDKNKKVEGAHCYDEKEAAPLAAVAPATISGEDGGERRRPFLLGMLPEDLMLRIVKHALPSIGRGFDDEARHYL